MTGDMQARGDRPISRRTALVLLGGAGLSAVAAACSGKISSTTSTPSAASITSSASGNPRAVC